MLHNSHYHRRHLILNIIHHLGPISRTELIELTDYRPASVGDLIRELLEAGLVVETGHSSGGHGRKRILLEINKEHLCAIGVSFTPSQALCLATGIDGRIFSQASVPIVPEQSKPELAREVTGAVLGLIHSCSSRELVGVGICKPLYDPLTYEATHSILANYNHFHDWIHHVLQPMLSQQTGLPVQSYSPVTLPALAEQRFGVARDAQNFLCIELSNGVGASIFCNGMAVGGAHGVAGELGHTVIEYDRQNTSLCYCGKPGCVESTTAFPALAAQIKAALDSGVFSVLSTHPKDQKITVSDIRRALDAGDRMCMHYVKDAAVRIGVSIANAVNLLNPELVVLYGFMLELGPYFLDQLCASIRENAVAVANDFVIRLSESMDTILPLGAAAELFTEYLKMDNYKWVYQLQPGDTAPKSKEEVI